MGRASLYVLYIQGSGILRILLVRKSYIVSNLVACVIIIERLALGRSRYTV